MLAAMGKTPSPMLDPSRNTFTYNNSLWMFALAGGTPVIGGGVRVDDLGSEPIGSFLSRTLSVTFGVQPASSDWSVLSDGLSGRIAYFGDLGASTINGLNTLGATMIRLFMAYGHYRVLADLKTDSAYCFLRESERRRAVNYGFLDTDPFVWPTDKPMYKDGNPGWIAHLRKERLPALMASVSGDLDNALAINEKPLVALNCTDPATDPNKRQAHV